MKSPGRELQREHSFEVGHWGVHGSGELQERFNKFFFLYLYSEFQRCPQSWIMYSPLWLSSTFQLYDFLLSFSEHCHHSGQQLEVSILKRNDKPVLNIIQHLCLEWDQHVQISRSNLFKVGSHCGGLRQLLRWKCVERRGISSISIGFTIIIDVFISLKLYNPDDTFYLNRPDLPWCWHLHWELCPW